MTPTEKRKATLEEKKRKERVGEVVEMISNKKWIDGVYQGDGMYVQKLDIEKLAELLEYLISKMKDNKTDV